MIDILVLNYNDYSTVIEHITKVKNYKSINKILIVDNLSTDNSYDILKNYVDDKVILISSEKNGGYGYGNNLGIKYLYEKFNSKYILLANPDVVYTDETLLTLERFLMDNNDYAIVAPFMLNVNGVKQYNTAFRIPEKWEYIFSLGFLIQKFVKSFYYKNVDSEKFTIKQVGAVAGSMFLMDAEKMIKKGMYDENIFLYCEELVLGLKMKDANYKIGLMLNETFIHNHSISINKSIKSEAKKRKILVNSKLYVIKNYYNANRIQYAIAWFLGKLSILECRFLFFIKRK